MMLVTRLFLVVVVFTASLVAHAGPGISQTDLTISGGASGANVHCLQAGSLKSGVFTATFHKANDGSWTETSKSGTVKFEEKARDDLIVELLAKSGKFTVQFDFVNQVIRERLTSTTARWVDRYVMLNATDEAASGDCVSSAAPNAAVNSKSERAGDVDAPDKEQSSDPGRKTSKPSNRNKKPKRLTSTPKAKALKNERGGKKGKDCFPIFKPYGVVEQRCQ